VGEVLRCPACQVRLRSADQALFCERCRRSYPLVQGAYRFVEQQSYTGSFGFQWLRHERTQLDTQSCGRSEVDFTYKTGLCREDVAGKLILDVGCGMGRYAEVVNRWGGQVVGIDLSHAVEAAARNLGERGVTILQADVFSLPFAPESFDLIYSLGVLHHTPDCEKAFKQLPGLLKPGGTIAIWLYSAYNRWYRMSDLYRKVTRRMPPPLLHTLCYGAVPLYWIHRGLDRIPLAGKLASGLLRNLIPMSFDEDPRWRVLDTFDWYSPWFQSKHTYEEVFRWFESCGLEDMRIAGVPVSLRGRKPEVVRCAG
jgi:SAM-dependent methyltransferase